MLADVMISDVKPRGCVLPRGSLEEVFRCLALGLCPGGYCLGRGLGLAWCMFESRSCLVSQQ